METGFDLHGLLAQTTVGTTQPAADGITDFINQLGLEKTWNQTQWWHWLVLLGAIFFTVVAGRVIAGILKRLATNLEGRSAHAAATVIRSGATPASLFVISLGISFGLGFIAMEPGAREVAGRAMTLLYVIAIGWFIFNLVDLVDLWLRSIASKTESQLDDQLAPLIRKTLRIFLVVLLGLFIAQNVFNQNISAWLAGLGIAGLAVSLAAQDSIKNLFGSITIFTDRPFVVGERIVFDGFDGTVEEIGFRSTRIRLLNGELATVPNAKFIDTSVRNVARRPSIPKTIELQLSADTPPQDVLRAVQSLRKVLEEPGLREPLEKAGGLGKVYFDELRGDVRVVKINYAFAPVDWWAFNDHLQTLQIRILETLEAENIEFGGIKTTLIGDPDQPLVVVNSSAPRN